MPETLPRSRAEISGGFDQTAVKARGHDELRKKGKRKRPYEVCDSQRPDAHLHAKDHAKVNEGTGAKDNPRHH